MQDECLYEVKNKNYMWIRIGLIALIPWLYMSFKWLFVLQTKGSGALMGYMNYILGSLILIPFVLMPIISRHKYSVVKFYADKLVVKGLFDFELRYNGIKTISRQKKAIYILGKDYEEYNKEYISLHSDNKYGTLMYKYSYNKLIAMPNTMEIYNKLVEMIGEKELEIQKDEITNSPQIFTHINKVPSKIFNCFFKISCSVLGALFLLLIIAASITTIKEDFFHNMNESVVILFIIISSILLFFGIDKFTKRGNEDIRCYEIYKDYILGIASNKSQIIKPINYKDILKVQVSIAGTSLSPKDVNIAMWYLRPDSNSIERIVLREINEDNGQIIIDLIRKAKGIEVK